MSDIRLFMFQSGTQQCKYQHIRMNQGVGENYEIPVPWFLLTHPDGFTLIDGGLAVEGLKDPFAYWGSATEQFKPVMSEEQGCLEQLKRIGIAPEDIRYVVLSHLHSDHTGAIGRFHMPLMWFSGESMNMPLLLTGLHLEPTADTITIILNLTGFFSTAYQMTTMTFTVMARCSVFSRQGIHRDINLFSSDYPAVHILRWRLMRLTP
jgi:mRNA degradation ribonuclease J1/J2